MDSWFILVLLGSSLTRVGANNATTVSPSVGITRSMKTSTAESVKEETKASNTTSSVTSPSVAPTFSPNLTLGPTYVTTVNASDSDNGTTRTASTGSVVTTLAPNGTWLPENQFTDTSTEPWEGNSSTVATTPETFPPSGTRDGWFVFFLFEVTHCFIILCFLATRFLEIKIAN
ncbi:hypothetical protein GH733_010056 [Mirounga leonina]|nr:hypothetical protein GH733_010056 [Mirounga leonina]